MGKKNVELLSKMINYYTRLPKGLTQKYHNPNIHVHGIEVPFRMFVCGASGSGKTNWLLNLLAKFTGTFDHITLCCKDSSEPLYRLLQAKISADQLTVCEGMDQIPALESLDPNCQHLVIFDDLVLAKDLSLIQEYFVRGRKVAKGVSCVFLSQTYYRGNGLKTIRQNCNYVVLKKISSTRDLGMVLSDFPLPISRQELTELYIEITRNPLDALLIDINKSKFRRNFDELS